MMVCAKANWIASVALAGCFMYAGCASSSQANAPTETPADGPATAAAEAPEEPVSEPEGEPSADSDVADDGAGDSGDTRTTEAIAAVIKANRDKPRACYEKVQKDVPNLRGDVVIRFVINPDGTVKTAEVNEARTTLKEAAVSSCIVEAISALTFPESTRGMETKVNYPFNFVP